MNIQYELKELEKKKKALELKLYDIEAKEEAGYLKNLAKKIGEPAFVTTYNGGCPAIAVPRRVEDEVCLFMYLYPTERGLIWDADLGIDCSEIYTEPETVKQAIKRAKEYIKNKGTSQEAFLKAIEGTNA